MIKIEASGESCLCDFTFDFYWQHKGSRLDPDLTFRGYSLRKLVEALKEGKTISIEGDVGNRLGSSLGVDLMRFGGMGGPIESTGKIIVNGNVGNRFGISMLRGVIYISGSIEEPLGNVIEVETDLSGYRKFISITEALERNILVVEPNSWKDQNLFLCDGIQRDTLGARNCADKVVIVKGNVGMSAGILMNSGSINISGNSDSNTGVLMKSGMLVVKGSTGDFTGAEMSGGEIFIEKSAGNYSCPKMKGGAVYAREGKPIPPARIHALSQVEKARLTKILDVNPLYTMMYRKMCL
ncbi:MAG: tributyrin esterase [Methanotrichaceae archaeon]|nr:tributyrin esterase [Methanotrichaceae archaeon]